MAAFASNMPSEVGLRLLLCPLGSNIVLRTASCSVGVVLPVYSTFKALESRNQDEQQRWLLYWAAYGSFSIAEVFTDQFLSWFPLYYHMKLAFLVWLQLPSVDGAKQLYMNHLRPFLLRHQARLDQIVGCLYSEMTKFVSAQQGGLQFAKTLLMKILGTGFGWWGPQRMKIFGNYQPKWSAVSSTRCRANLAVEVARLNVQLVENSKLGVRLKAQHL